MGILENSLGAVFGQGPGGNSGPSFGSAPYAPLATALIGMLAAKAMTGGFGNLFGGGAQPAPVPQQGQIAHHEDSGGLLGGLGGLLHHFQQGGLGDVAQSWVGPGQNQPTNPTQINQALGPDVVRQLAQKTGMSEQQVAQQLAQELPDMINRLTPQGRLPTQAEASSFLNGGNPLQPR